MAPQSVVRQPRVVARRQARQRGLEILSSAMRARADPPGSSGTHALPQSEFLGREPVRAPAEAQAEVFQQRHLALCVLRGRRSTSTVAGRIGIVRHHGGDHRGRVFARGAQQRRDPRSISPLRVRAQPRQELAARLWADAAAVAL